MYDSCQKASRRVAVGNKKVFIRENCRNIYTSEILLDYQGYPLVEVWDCKTTSVL